MATRRKPRPTAFETFVDKNYDDLVCEYAETGAESEGVDFDDFAEEAYARSKKKKGAKRRPNPGGGADLLQEFATKIRVSDNFSRLDLSLEDAACMLADFAVRSLGPLVAHEAELPWAVSSLRDHAPVTDMASATKAGDRARDIARNVLGRVNERPRDPLYVDALRAIGEVCSTAKHRPSETPSACVEAMQKTIAARVSEETVTNAARRMLAKALHPPAARTEFVAAEPRSSLFGSFRSMFSSSPSARAANPASHRYVIRVRYVGGSGQSEAFPVYSIYDESLPWRDQFPLKTCHTREEAEEWLAESPREENPASLYSVAVDGRPVYSSHLRDQAMQRFMQKRSSGHGEVTLSIDGDVAYRAASGGSVRVGNPLSEADGRGYVNGYFIGARADLYGADLAGANLRGADLEGADLREADLRGADLSHAILDGANLTGATLSGADLSVANLYRANLSGANLEGAILRWAPLTEANLTGANLTGAILAAANLTGANLTGANLTGAELWNANLRGANLSGANLEGADLMGATMPDGRVYSGRVPNPKVTNWVKGAKRMSNPAFSVVGSADPAVLDAALRHHDGPTATVEAEYGSAVVEGTWLTLAHHGSRSHNLCPCLEENRQPPADLLIGVSHFDLDTLGGVMALLGIKPNAPDFWRVAARIDTEGPHKLPLMGATRDTVDCLNAFWAWSEDNRVSLPRASAQGPAPLVDLTDLFLKASSFITELLSGHRADAVSTGRAWAARNEALERETLVSEYGNGAVLLRSSDKFVNHLYGPTAAAVVGYNTKAGSITVSFSDEDSRRGLSACDIMQDVYGPLAGGHAGIAGTPRGETYTLDDAADLAGVVADKLHGRTQNPGYGTRRGPREYRY